jgi:enamine deaminase RidA (YjgF/YER057c/UK114 family)
MPRKEIVGVEIERPNPNLSAATNARTTVTVAALNFPELLVEITVTACIPG